MILFVIESRVRNPHNVRPSDFNSYSYSLPFLISLQGSTVPYEERERRELCVCVITLHSKKRKRKKNAFYW